ncbi:MAG: glycoside hydrolase family 2 TIM barrel-domain containing protein [Anaerolineae bacterium]|nr:glycoside hydrolase family 2 TIM barrel-domain containing protein [Anaerolineae bacterium]
MTAMRRDLFAEIAAELNNDAQPRTPARATLVEPQPLDLPARFLPAESNDPSAAFAPTPKLDTPERLAQALDEYRRRYAPFLANLAPELETTRIRLPIYEFDWRIATAEDASDFVGVLEGRGTWQRIRIPHYGGPLGRATTFYRTCFVLSEEMLARDALFVSFGGVDYRAHVFLNGVYLGSHEGFFAPFEFDARAAARAGENTLVIRVENDAICMGNDSWGADGHLYEGDKLYAATGPGYDDPEIGWQHCPPGMGIYQQVCVEARSAIFISDIFVRPLLDQAAAEAWVEVYNTKPIRCPIAIEISLFGQNFEEAVFVGERYELAGPAGPTTNQYRLPFSVPNPRIWDPETPWLYQLQVRLLDAEGRMLDAQKAHFGMRSFRMDTDGEPKGRFYLNGRPIRLRGANTMGFEQQDVMRGDLDQLRDDILLAKIGHINFLRLTQRPVQPEVYDMCDKLGMMTQTDLPLFAVLRRNQFVEAVRQAGEMERLVRNHPCNILVTYINEPFPRGWNKLHRHLSRPELESFFLTADQVVHLANPDRVIKAVDGDYDPPGPGLPDNHCYCGWYNGHGIDLGKLHRGYWQAVKPGWFYGCGEFGAEGLDPADLMRRRYPPAWLPQTPDEERSWTPDRIPGAQTGRFHYLWFDTQHSVDSWCAASQEHQAWVTRLMTEAFRRDRRMVSFAIHLFIDAFPASWMKTIMDTERRPKPAYFAYREALTPLMVNLRTDRWAFWAEEPMCIEVWVCNDRPDALNGLWLHYQVEIAGQVVFSQRTQADVPACDSAFQGFLRLPAPYVEQRTTAVIRLGLLTAQGQVVHDTAMSVEIFPRLTKMQGRVWVIGSAHDEAGRLARALELNAAESNLNCPPTILIGDLGTYALRKDEVTEAVLRGATAVFLNLPIGQHEIFGDQVEVSACGMNPRHFVSRATGHPLVAGFKPYDFRFWYNDEAGYVTPLLTTVFDAPDWMPILASGNGSWQGSWKPALAAAEKRFGHGLVRICQVELANRVAGNPVAAQFTRRLLSPAGS